MCMTLQLLKSRQTTRFVRTGLGVAIAVCAAASAFAQNALNIQSALQAMQGLQQEVLVNQVTALMVEYPDQAADIYTQASQMYPQASNLLTARFEQVNPALFAQVQPSFGPIVAAAGGGLGIGPVAAGAAAAGGVAAAAGGGGGSGSGGGSSVAAPAPSTPSAPPGGSSTSGNSDGDQQQSTPVTAADFETNEYFQSGGLALINASSAYARGAQGEGVTVGVIDTGINPDLSEFSGKLDGGFDYFLDSATMSDPEGHGSEVSSIIAAKKNGSGMHGVAPKANIRMYKIASSSGNLSGAAFSKALDAVLADGVPIVNLSLSYGAENFRNIDDTVASYSEKLVNIESNGTLVVASTGNSGESNPHFPALVPYVSPAHLNDGTYTYAASGYTGNFDEDWSSAADGFLAVVSVHRDGDFSKFSNACGVAANWCLAAPGALLEATGKDGELTTVNGTSYAAPHVAGAAAVLKELFPSLTHNQIAQILLETADKSGIYADSSLYGQGLLDLEAATQPLGDLEAAGINLSNSSFNGGSVVGGNVTAQLAATAIVGQDRFNRTYSAHMNVTTAALAPRIADHFSYAHDEYRLENVASDLKLGIVSSQVDEQKQLPDLALMGGTKGSLQWYAAEGNALGWLRAWQQEGGRTKGLAALERMAAEGFANPYMNVFDEDARAFGMTLPFGQSSALELTSYQRDGVVAGAMGYQYQNKGAGFNIEMGTMAEDAAFLGASGTGAFGVGGAATSWFGVKGFYALNKTWRLQSAVWYGRTQVTKAAGSAWLDDFNLTSRAASAGFTGQSVWQAGDRLNLLYKRPLHVVHGQAQTSLVASGGAPLSLDFSATTPAHMLQAVYTQPLSNKANIGFAAWQQVNVAHTKGAHETGVMVLFDMSF